MNAVNDSVFSDPRPFIVNSNPLDIVFLYRYGLGLIFLFGFIGNLGSIVTFMQAALRITSTGCLFLILAVSDTAFLLVSIFDFIEVALIQRPILLENYDSLCRFRWFSLNFFQCCSAWLLVLITMDRWLRTRFPFKTNKWCTRRNVALGVILIMIIGLCLHSHMLNASYFGRLIPGIATAACGPVDPMSSYANFFFPQWPIIQVVFVCLIPVIVMLLGSIDIHQVAVKTRFRVLPTGAILVRQVRQDRLHRQMLILMISSIIIFFVTTLPVSIRRIVGACQIFIGQNANLNQVLKETAILAIILCLNYAINFYIHCLTSKLFRDEFLRFLKMIHQLVKNRVERTTLAAIHPVMPTHAANEIAMIELHQN